MYTIHKIGIAGVSFNFIFKDLPHKLNLKLKERYKGFYVLQNTKAINIFTKFEKANITLPSKPEIKIENGRLFIEREDFSFEMKNSKATLNLLPSIYSFDSFLRTILSLLLPKKNGILAHSASFIYKDRAYIFAGKSESGKTTISELSKKKAFIMSDELTAVFSNNYAYSLPFWGNMKGKGKNIKAQIAKIFIIKKADYNKVEKLSLDEFLSSFLPCVVNFTKSPHIINKIFSIAIQLYQNVETGKLFFTKKDNPFLKII